MISRRVTTESSWRSTTTRHCYPVYLGVGGLFDGDQQKVINWIDATGGKSAAFDFPSRYLLFDSIRTDDFGTSGCNQSGPGGAADLIESGQPCLSLA